MDTEGFDSAAHASRRAKLGKALGTRAALIAAGRPRARNYAANVFPHRSNSHFLYLFGLPHREAFGLWSGESWTLYLPKPDADDAVWHGPVPGFAEIAELTGCPVRAIDELPGALRGCDAATLPSPDLETCAAQSSLLGREIRPGAFTDGDRVLAEAMIALRLAHDEAAVAQMRLGAAATARAHRAGMGATRPGVRESVVHAAMEAELMAAGMTTAYNSIVTVHGEVLHNNEHHHTLGERDLLLADVGAETATGWASDVTRTWPVAGTFSKTQADIYDVVLRAQKAAIAGVRPGARYRDIHLGAARDMARGLVDLGILRGDPAELVADGVAALLFPHGVGHLIGLDVHDMEDLGDLAGYAPGRTRSEQFGLSYLRLDRDLVPGMAVTIEPGIYIVPAILENAGLAKVAGDRLDRRALAAYADVRGIRIEDDVVVTATGADVLTAAIPKDRSAVEACVGRWRPSDPGAP